jgi:hypothetical protein
MSTDEYSHYCISPAKSDWSDVTEQTYTYTYTDPESGIGDNGLINRVDVYFVNDKFAPFSYISPTTGDGT